MTTKIVFVLDRSGSMGGKETDVIGGFNSFLREQKELGDEATLTTILFDDKYEVLHEDKNIKNIEPITEKDYFVRGSTALLDAVGKAINTVKPTVKRFDRVLFMINTDGYENSSHEYTNDKIKSLVKELEKSGKWKFVFLGADVDAFSIGGGMGITYTANYSNTSQGQRSFYDAVSVMTTSYRTNESDTGTLDTSGFEKLE